MILHTVPVYRIKLPTPPIGNKIFLAQKPGFYVLEEGPCVWQAQANTHQGTGCIKVYDGVPDDAGEFRNPPDVDEFAKNGRMLFNANPPILGMYMFAGGLIHGLTLEISGMMNNIGPCITITWMPKNEVKRNIK